MESKEFDAAASDSFGDLFATAMHHADEQVDMLHTYTHSFDLPPEVQVESFVDIRTVDYTNLACSKDRQQMHKPVVLTVT